MRPPPSAPTLPDSNPGQPRLFPRSRSLLFSIGLFVVLDLGILALVWTQSFRLTQNAIRIDLAGRQTVLTQRTAKCLYQIRDFQMLNRNIDPPKNELLLTRDLFDVTLRAFRDGGSVPTEDGTPVYVSPVEEIAAQKTVNDAQQIWEAFLERLTPIVTARDSVDPVQLQSVIEFSNSSNLKLLGLMTLLTHHLEETSQHGIESLRLFQTLAVLVSLLNLLVVVATLDRRLNRAEAEYQAFSRDRTEDVPSAPTAAAPFPPPAVERDPGRDPQWEEWKKLVETLATETQKNIVLRHDPSENTVPIPGRHLELSREIVPLLLEHLIRQDLEPPLERLIQKKPEQGSLTLGWSVEKESFRLVLRSDGRGLDLDRIRRRAIETGLLSPLEANALTETQVPPLIFAPKFQEATGPEKAAGLSRVKQRVVDELNGEIQVRSQPGQFTEFRVILPPEPPEMMKGPSHEPA